MTPERVISFVSIMISLIIPLSAQATFRLDRESYQVGDPITASWSNGPGNSTDWVGIYPHGIVPDGSPPSTAWQYVNGTTSATTPRRDGSVTFPGTIPAGQWTAHFLANDRYTQITPGVDFTVSDPDLPTDLLVVTDSIRRVHAVVGEAYHGSLSAYARSQNGEVVFSKEAGPEWLGISSKGDLSGTPGPEDEGGNHFEVAISDGLDRREVTLTIPVFRPGWIDLPRLKVLAFNIWVGTSRVPDGYLKGLDSIILSDADLIAICENGGRAAQWAADLGWHAFQFGSDNAILSRYPLVDTFTASHAVGATVRLAESPRREIHFWSCHFTAYPYGPYDARDAGGSDANRRAAALAAEVNSGRVAQINDILARSESQLAGTEVSPYLLLGDFNCPSQLDWTPETAEAGLHFGLVIDWPVTRATEEAQLSDAYRARHPDPVAMPGNTWTPINPNDVQDRIDMIHFKGSPLSVVNCEVFTTLDAGRWPSDHAGVLAEFEVGPVDEDQDGLADLWENKFFGNLQTQGPDDDPDGDSRNNRFEQSFGLDPNNRDDPVPISVVRASPETLLSYRRLSGGRSEGGVYRARGLTYHLESSADLESWHPVAASEVIENPAEALGEGVERARITLTTETGDRRYFRVRVP